MTNVVLGANGAIGATLMRALPNARGFDLPLYDLRRINSWSDMLDGCSSVYFCAGQCNPYADIQEHAESAMMAANAIFAAVAAKIECIYFASSTWVDVDDERQQNENTRAYGAAKRAIEALAVVYPQIKIVRVGWYVDSEICPTDIKDRAVPDWLSRIWWSRADLLRAFEIPAEAYA